MSKKGPTILYRGKTAFPSDYAAAEDFEGKDATLQIERVAMREIKTEDGKQVKLMLYFKGAKKPMICNKTNATTIAKVTGEVEAVKWPGHRITLYPTTTSAFGDPHCPCIRVRDKAPTPKQEPKQAAPDQPASDAPWESDDAEFERQQAAKQEGEQGALFDQKGPDYQ